MAGVLTRVSFAAAAEKPLKQRKYCKKHYFLVVGLEKVEKIENYKLTQLNTLLERSNAEIKNKHG